MKKFFNFDGYMGAPEGYMSWQHLVFVTTVLLIMTVLAIYFGIKNKNSDEIKKNKVLIVSAILIDSFELFKIFILCLRAGSLSPIKVTLPLFLCSIQLITIPLAAFSKGRIKEAALDFVFVFGILGAIAGTVGAAQNYNAYPVLSFNNMVSTFTHCVSGFCSLYIVITGMQSMKKNNIWILCAILLGFMLLALIADYTIPYNYMFLVRDDGTPYIMITKLVKGNKVLYPLGVLFLFALYIVVFYAGYYLTCGLIKKRHAN